MTDQTNLKISPAKGRPMLHWVGKRPLDYVTAFPAQLVERFAPLDSRSPLPDSGFPLRASGSPLPKPGEGPGVRVGDGLLFHGDNKDVLAWLLANGYRGKIDLVSIDPPFDSGADYVRKVELRGLDAKEKVEGESYTLGEQIQYTDIWANDTYLQFMYERLLLLRELLKENGTIFVHANHEKVHLLRCILDEVFGSENFRNDIVWKHGPAKSHPNYFGRIKDTILFYCKGEGYTWNKQFLPISDDYRESFRRKDETGWYVTQPLHSGKPAKNVPEWQGVRPPGGRGWAYKIETLDRFEAEGKVEWSEEGVPRLKRYLHEVDGAVIQDLWDDILDIASPELLQVFLSFLEQLNPAQSTDIWDDISAVLDRSADHLAYPTQKPIELVERILLACSSPGDLVLDVFVGAGTTSAAAQKLGRRWIAADINKGAIQTTSKRLQAIIREQIQAQKKSSLQGRLPLDGDDEEETPAPAALAFSVYRVNDYDLTIQHNEAVNLAVEHIGIDRAKTDAFFDGTLGKQLVKIVPFNHPLTLLDLQLLKDELAARPQEDRDVVLVCLGKELALDAWLEDYNKHRPVNKIEIIELRTDQKYGKFFVHQPAQAEVDIRREDDKIVVEIQDFISPTIVERLEIDTPLLKARIPDWRAMVDVVLIDADYDGEVFNIALSDVPEKKDDLVAGCYELPVPEGPTRVAVKIIDMLGEEVIVVKEI